MVSNEERRHKVKKFLAAKSKIVTAKEYDDTIGKVLIFNTNKCTPDKPTKFGTTCVEYVVIEKETGVERIVNATAISYINAVEEKLAQRPEGTDVPLRIKKTGLGTDIRYTAEFAE